PVHPRGDPPSPLFRRLDCVNLREPVDRFEYPILISARPRFPPERVKNLDRVSVCGPDRDRLRDAFDRISVPGPEAELLRGGAEATLVLRPTDARLGFRDLEHLLHPPSADLGRLPSDEGLGPRVDAHDPHLPIGHHEAVREGGDEGLDPVTVEVELLREFRAVEGTRDLGSNALAVANFFGGEVMRTPGFVEPNESKE